MNAIRLAVILLAPLASGYTILLDRDIAGLNLFKRLLLTLQRAGIENFVVLSKHLPQEKWSEIENDLHEDVRFKGQLSWSDQKQYIQNGDENLHQAFDDPRGFLLLDGNLVTSAKLIDDFIWKTWWTDIGIKQQIARLKFIRDDPARIFIFPPHSGKRLDDFLRSDTLDGPIAPVSMEGESFLLKTVEDAPSARQAEREVIQNHKFHYSQLMDKWFNSHFSLPISSRLVKTFLTPNQVTLLGLLIGLGAGWLFSLGNYWGGLFGGILLVGTAIWDCCDGDVARLKFMESDFGDTLDTCCDNIINVFVFTGMMIGTARSQGLSYALTPFALLALGGTAIFILIYFPKGGKGSFFKDIWMYGLIQVLASRNFIYIILIFAVFGRIDWFLWLAGIGSNVFALILFFVKRRISPSGKKNCKNEMPTSAANSPL